MANSIAPRTVPASRTLTRLDAGPEHSHGRTGDAAATERQADE
jgi:hypothetical protein